MHKISLLFSLLIGFAFCQSVCSNRATLLNLAYTECTLDPVCMDSFYLSESSEVWERPRFDYLMLKVINSASSNVTLICSDAEIFSEWFSLAKFWNFCRKNEVYSMIDGGCVCNSGKNCDLTMNGASGYSTRDLKFLIVLLLLGGAYYHAYTISILKSLAQPPTSSILPSTDPKSMKTVFS